MVPPPPRFSSRNAVTDSITEEKDPLECVAVSLGK